MQLPWGGLENEAVGAWDALAEQVRGFLESRERTAIISHEILATASRGAGGARPGVAGPPRHRDPRGAVGPRPGAADPGRVAGERQAPPRAAATARFLAQVRDPARASADRRLVLGRAGDPRHPRPLGRRPAAGAGPRGDRAAAGRPARPAVAAVQPRPSASTTSTSTSRPSAPTRRWASPRPPLVRRINVKANKLVPPAAYRPLVRELHRPPDPVAPGRLAAADAAARRPRLGRAAAAALERRGARARVRRGRRPRRPGRRPARRTTTPTPTRPTRRRWPTRRVDAITALLVENARLVRPRAATSAAELDGDPP